MNATPRLSIGLPVYNGEQYLAESIDALLGQSYSDFELVISDNASTDDTADICHRYQREDSRIRYIRQDSNLGCAGNHNFVFGQARGELFSWASSDDLYARDLLQRCVEALDERPEVVLASAWTAAVDGSGTLTQAMDYPLATSSPRAPERFRSMLFGSGADDYGLIRADDDYGVIRAAVLRKIAPHNSFLHADKAIMMELALHGPFYQTPDWLYFRRDHADRAQRANPTARSWCTNQDPRRASRLRHPVARLYAEYFWSFVPAIRRAPLSSADRRECYGHLGRWAADRAAKAAGRLRPGGPEPQLAVAGGPLPALSVHAMVVGQESRQP